jgi:hypothetical protein
LNEAKRALSDNFKRFPIIAKDFLMRNGVDENDLPTSGQHSHDLVLNVSLICLEPLTDSTKWPHTKGIAVSDCLLRQSK